MYIIILLLYRQRILYPPSVLWLASLLGHTFGEFALVYTLHQDLQWGSCTTLIMLPDFLMLTRISDLSWKNYSVWTSGCIPLRILVWLEWHISQTRKIIVSFVYIYVSILICYRKKITNITCWPINVIDSRRILLLPVY